MQLRNKKESELQSWKENSGDESVCDGIKRMLADFVSLQMFFSTHGFIGCLFSRVLVVTRNGKWCHEREYQLNQDKKSDKRFLHKLPLLLSLFLIPM